MFEDVCQYFLITLRSPLVAKVKTVDTAICGTHNVRSIWTRGRGAREKCLCACGGILGCCERVAQAIYLGNAALYIIHTSSYAYTFTVHAYIIYLRYVYRRCIVRHQIRICILQIYTHLIMHILRTHHIYICIYNIHAYHAFDSVCDSHIPFAPYPHGSQLSCRELVKGLEKGELLTVLLKHLQNRAQDKAQNIRSGFVAVVGWFRQ